MCSSTVRPIPYIASALLIINGGLFLFELSLSNFALGQFFQQWTLQPRQLFFGNVSAELHALLTTLFIHGSWIHLINNMLFLSIFGSHLETQLGSTRFLLFYLLCGLLANIIQLIAEPTSPINIAGASGAISGLLGGFTRLTLGQTTNSSIPIHTFFFPHVELPAILILTVWFITQFFNGVAQIGTTQLQVGGVAFFAHIGGFIVGFILIKLFYKRDIVPPTKSDQS